MASINRITLTGNLTRDAEMRTLPSGSTVIFFDLAVSRSYKDKSGAFQEETLFIRVNYWSRYGESMMEFLTKGKPVFVDGHLKQRSWEKDGQKRTVMEVETFLVQPIVRTTRNKDTATGPIDGPPPIEESGEDVPF